MLRTYLQVCDVRTHAIVHGPSSRGGVFPFIFSLAFSLISPHCEIHTVYVSELFAVSGCNIVLLFLNKKEILFFSNSDRRSFYD